jgi:hypothetical protein
MVALRTRRRTAAARARTPPDDRVVVATALLALSILGMMLCAGIA